MSFSTIRMKDIFLSPYNPKETEERIYKLWEDSGFFNPDYNTNSNTKSFTLIMPPTNANGSLHAGHGLVMTIEDIIVRYKRMNGFRTLWLPGLDHAGFETQVVYEKKLEKEGRTRFEIEPKELYKEILDFTLNNSTNIKSQIRKMGASCDWSREKFTLDSDIVKTVYQTFKKLNDDNLIYRGNRIVSWCTKHQTSFSDLEIKDEERVESFYYLKYGPFTIATARPETKFGDKYVVMHPKDKRYKDYQDGQKIELEWINGPITATIIKDEAIDMDFGTGVMTITPWHDAVDFGIAERHNLEKEQIIDFYGKLLPIAGEFSGMKIVEARPLIIEKLQSKGLVEISPNLNNRNDE
jgi:valyl-tRNA synthetase